MADVRTHTPSGAEVELVTADEWMDMSITKLFDQKMILANRQAAVAQYGNPQMLAAMQRGMIHLDKIIRYKEQEKIKHIDKRQKDITGLI